MTVAASQLVNELIGEYVFDVTADAALRALDRKHKRMVRRARLRTSRVSLGSTTAGQRDYTIGIQTIQEVLDIEVGGVPYNRAPRRVQAAFARNALQWSPAYEGLFVDTADTTGLRQIALIPTPSESGLSIVVYAAVEAPTLVALFDNVLVPDDYTDALVAGAAATFLEREPEQLGYAQALDAKFDNACEELRRQVARQLRGNGPATIQLG